MPEPQLVLVRGLPGSGKSTIAKKEYPDHHHFEADMYQYCECGKYNFHPEVHGRAHEWCLNETISKIEQGENVVVSNTFTRNWEMLPYFGVAKMYGADLVVREAEAPWANDPIVCAEKTVHKVPLEIIEAMKERWEELP